MPVSAPVFAYLGPAGTYTHEAARAFAARLGIDEPALLECASFDEVFDAVDRGKCEFGVVAKENSLEGSVTATLDNFAFKSQASILGEHVLDIHHCLVLHPDAKLEDVTCVASHAQGLAQCRRFLAERLPGRATVTTSSTAESARMAAEDVTWPASRTRSPPSCTARAWPSATSRTISATRRRSPSSAARAIRPCSAASATRRRSRCSCR
ncbi:MAG: prephenate dehydratase domain-containing protein [Gordonibacter pamelaeae]